MLRKQDILLMCMPLGSSIYIFELVYVYGITLLHRVLRNSKWALVNTVMNLRVP
jgi:hypothetical protein